VTPTEFPEVEMLLWEEPLVPEEIVAEHAAGVSPGWQPGNPSRKSWNVLKDNDPMAMPIKCQF
jgi:hypothetical protein